jgi:hypothetical protein
MASQSRPPILFAIYSFNLNYSVGAEVMASKRFDCEYQGDWKGTFLALVIVFPKESREMLAPKPTL